MDKKNMRETEHINIDESALKENMELLRKICQGALPYNDAIVQVIGDARKSIRALRASMVDVSIVEKELNALENDIFGMLLHSNIDSPKMERHANQPEEKGQRPTKKEIEEKAKEFVERMKGARDHGEVHNQIVRWSWGENLKEAEHYYPGWTSADFLSYAQEIKKLEPKSEWGTALYEI